MHAVLVWLCLVQGIVLSTRGETLEEVYSWVTVDYDWMNDSMKQDFVQSGKYIKENNAPGGIKIYGKDVFLSVSRLLAVGVPSTLNKVVMKLNTPVLQPFPSWDMQTLGDCRAFQYVQAKEVDPTTGQLWVVDTGKSAEFNTSITHIYCPPKLVIIDLESGEEVHRYVFPETIVSPTGNFLNDMILDYVNGKAAYAYITDTSLPGGLVVYDYKSDDSYRFEDPRMSIEPNSDIFIDGVPVKNKGAINGIAMSPDFNHVYFSAISGVTLYRVPTQALRNKSSVISEHIEVVGKKPSQGDGMVFSEQSLYFSGINDSTVYRWKASEDIEATLLTNERNTTLNFVETMFTNETTLAWVDSFAIDEYGYLWLSSSDVGRFSNRILDFADSNANFRIFKTFIGESSHL